MTDSGTKNATVTYPENGMIMPIGLSGLCRKNVSHLDCNAGADVNCAAVGRTFTMASIPLR